MYALVQQNDVLNYVLCHCFRTSNILAVYSIEFRVPYPMNVRPSPFVNPVLPAYTAMTGVERYEEVLGVYREWMAKWSEKVLARLERGGFV